MQQIFNFIFKNSYKLLFLLLLGISLILTIQAHSYHRSKIISSANFLTGGVYEQINSVNEYISLRTKNEELANENARLKELLFGKEDPIRQIPPRDSVRGIRRTSLITSRVIHNSYNTLENFITIGESTLSFFGFGPQPGHGTSLGLLIEGAGPAALQGNWWLVAFPCGALVLLAICISFIGDGLRDALDPKLDTGK